MQAPTPAPQRNRRADRYKQQTGVAPSAGLLARTAAPEAPAPMARPRRTPRKPEADKLPTWMTAGIIAGLILCLALFAAKNLMEAYLYQRQAEREAAHQKVVDAHPLYFTDLIDQYAAENNLQPAFVAAIILNESSFRTTAESNLGARGLMQLMPDTAQWIAGKLEDDAYSFERMLDAEQNIRYGTWYLGYLSRLFRGDPVTVASAYHAGQSKVTSWLGDKALSPDGLRLTLDSIPYPDTKTYAGRVLRDYAIYDALFYQTAPAGYAAAVPAGR